MTNKKITYISLMQIIGPIFVVLGHSLNGLDCPGAWYVFSKEWIYIFHMPLFFLVSGYLLSFKGYLSKKSYGQFILGKSKRLLLPYLIWNLVFWLPKFLVNAFISDNASLNVFDALRAFVYPRQNVWGHTWFLMGLFIVFLATPIFQKLFQQKKLWTSICSIVVCAILYVLPISNELLAFSDLHKDLLFFIIGCLLGQIDTDRFKTQMKKFRILFIIGAVASSFAALFWFEITKPFHFIPCTFILLALLSIFVSVEKLPEFFEKLSSYSFGIYIMHWPVMIAVRIVLHQILNINATVTAVAMSIFGYVIPIFVIIAIRALPIKKIKDPLKYLLGV